MKKKRNVYPVNVRVLYHSSVGPNHIYTNSQLIESRVWAFSASLKFFGLSCWTFMLTHTDSTLTDTNSEKPSIYLHLFKQTKKSLKFAKSYLHLWFCQPSYLTLSALSANVRIAMLQYIYAFTRRSPVTADYSLWNPALLFKINK